MSTPELEMYLALAQETMRRCYAEEDATAVHQWLLERLARMGGDTEESARMTWEESFDYYMALLEKRKHDAQMPADERKMLDWPWVSWNSIVDPLEPGLLAVVGAGDGIGKTILAECLAEHWARRKNRVVFVHYELNRALMMDRRMARHTGLTRRILKSGTMTPEQETLVVDVRPRLLAWDGSITYLHTPGWTMEKTVQELRKLLSEGLCDVVILDYLEKNAASRRQLQFFGNNSFQREADNVEQIKDFAEKTETPVLMLTQMNKSGKQSSFEDMDRTDLRGAGEKTEKANIVVLLHRARENGGYSNIVSVMVDKNSVGPQGSFQQIMEPEFFRVADLAPEILPGIRR